MPDHEYDRGILRFSFITLNFILLAKGDMKNEYF